MTVVTVPRSSLGSLGVFVSVKDKFPTVDECEWIFCDQSRIRLNRDASFKSYRSLYFSICSTVERNVMLRAEFHGFASETIQRALQERKRSVDVFSRHLAKQQAKMKEGTPQEDSRKQHSGLRQRFIWKPDPKNFVQQNKLQSVVYLDQKAERLQQMSATFNSKKREVVAKRQLLLLKDKQRRIYEVTKSDLKKGMKRVLVNVLTEKELSENFMRNWLSLIAFFDFHQTIVADVREARAQFSEYLRVTTLMQLYISSFGSKITTKGEGFDERQLTTSLQ